jgi:anti-sigma factor RsiW
MNCEEARALLHANVDGELDLVHSLEVQTHLENCGGCSIAVQNHQTLRRAMQAGSLYYQPPSIGRLLPREKKPRGIYWSAGLAAALVIAAFFVGRLQPRESNVAPEILDSHLRSLLPGHLADVQSTDQHAVKPWFNGKLNFSPPVADFAPQGFPLTGGRADSVGGREVAALVYGHRQHVINVYVWPSPSSRATGFHKSEQQGYNVIHWTGSGFEWWVISDLNANELADFAGLLHAAAP